MNEQPTIEDQLADFALGECVVEAGDNQMWIGTRYWGALQRQRKVETAGYAAIVEKAATDVALTRLQLHGHPAFIRIGEQLCRLYQRPDGESVVIADDYASTVELFIGSTDDVRLMQATSPLRPVCFVTAEGQTIGVVMPIRVS